MRINEQQPSYWQGPRTKDAPAVLAEKISKGAWMDLYADLFNQTHGEGQTQEAILADAKRRLATLKANGLRN